MRKNQFDYVELAKHNYLKVIIKDSKNQKKLDKFLESIQTNSKDNFKIEVIDKSEIIEMVDDSLLIESIQKNSSPLDIVDGFISGMVLDSDIELPRLTKIFDELYTTAKLLEGI